MHKIEQILFLEKWVKDGKEHLRTHAMLDNEEIAIGYGDYKVGDMVQAWYDDRWDKYSMRLPKYGKLIEQDGDEAYQREKDIKTAEEVSDVN